MGGLFIASYLTMLIKVWGLRKQAMREPWRVKTRPPIPMDITSAIQTLSKEPRQAFRYFDSTLP